MPVSYRKQGAGNSKQFATSLKLYLHCAPFFKFFLCSDYQTYAVAKQQINFPLLLWHCPISPSGNQKIKGEDNITQPGKDLA